MAFPIFYQKNMNLDFFKRIWSTLSQQKNHHYWYLLMGLNLSPTEKHFIYFETATLKNFPNSVFLDMSFFSRFDTISRSIFKKTRTFDDFPGKPDLFFQKSQKCNKGHNILGENT